MMDATVRTSHGMTRPGPDPFWTQLGLHAAIVALLGSLLFGAGRRMFYALGFGPPAARSLVAAAARQETLVREGVVVSRIAKGVGSPVAGVIERCCARRGERVRRGQLLFQVDARAARAALSEDEANAAMLDREIRQTRRARAARFTRMDSTKKRLAERMQVARAAEAALLGTALVPAAFTPVESSPPPVDLRIQLDELNRNRARYQQTYHEKLVDLLHRQSAARQAAQRLRERIAQAKRYSPISGVVTSVRQGKGDWVPAGRPVVRVDDPKGYRIVLLTREQTSARLATGSRQSVRGPGGVTQATLEKIEPGWGRELFYSWVWLQPLAPEGLIPGQRVEVTLRPMDVARAG